jgi:CheY-like chemotaxis protein
VRILLIDDSREIRQLVAELLIRAGHEIVGQAADGRTGLEMALAQGPDLVITDWRMPVMDGLEVTRRIRAASPSLAILAFCSTSAAMVHDAFLQAGTDRCIDKRDIQALLAAVRGVEHARPDGE